MLKILRQSVFIFLLVQFPSVFSQNPDLEEDYVNNILKYDDYNYKSNIKTVQLHPLLNEYGLPILDLVGVDQLELNFDDLDGDRKQYSMSFIYCNADWSPSSLMVSETMEGFYEININRFSFSMNTYQKYTYYSIVFPQNNVKFTKSGNYILYVYQDGDKNNLVLTRRFMVFEDRVKIVPTVRQPIAGEYQFKKQQVDFNIVGNTYPLSNPYKDLKVVIMQNLRWDNAVTDIKPTFVNNNELDYSLNDASLFDAGNEFRYFDVRSTKFLTERVREITRDENNKFHAYIYPEEIKRTRNYTYYIDLNGAYQIRNSEGYAEPETEADYVEVHFFIPYIDQEPNGNFYIMGKLTDWRMNKNSRMTYNQKRLGYEATLYLKQGYYNYMFVFSSDPAKPGDQTLMEGNHWATENEYYILVYHRPFGTYHDKLIGLRRFTSFKR